MAGVVTGVATSPKDLSRLCCQGCGRLLMRISEGALRPSKMIEAKCPKCDFYTYEIGKTT